MSYNLTAIADNTTGLLTLTQGVNSNLMDGWLGILLLIGLTMIFGGSYLVSTGDGKKAVSGASFIMAMLSILLNAVNLVPNLAMWLCVIGACVATAIVWKE